MNNSHVRILIVEDDAVSAEIQQSLLATEGYAVRIAVDGNSAIVSMEQWLPDIIVLDMRLPDVSGRVILERVAALDAVNRPDVLAASVQDSAETVVRALEAGAADFIRKPLVHREFLLRVRALAELRYHRRRNEENIKKLSRYFSRDIASRILDGSISDTLSGEMLKCSVMIFDLRKSTSLGEQMVPGLFFQFLTAFFGGVGEILHRCGGSVNRFTGDGFIATFGLNAYSDSATHLAVRCALELRQYVEKYNKRRPPYLKAEVGFGIGVTTGDVYAGNVGSAHKLEYTIFGDAVNLASRLESMTKQAKIDILIDAPTREICGTALKVKRMKTTSIRGKSESVTMYFPEEFNLPIAGNATTHVDSSI